LGVKTGRKRVEGVKSGEKRVGRFKIEVKLGFGGEEEMGGNRLMCLKNRLEW